MFAVIVLRVTGEVIIFASSKGGNHICCLSFNSSRGGNNRLREPKTETSRGGNQ